jgi:raffinose/stachyose/melibiose transport system permease protein
MYIRGFQASQMGAASVIGVILVAFGLILTLVIQRLAGRDLAASQMEGM